MAVVNEVSTVSHIPQFVPFGLLYYTQDTGDLYIGTGFSTGSDYVGGNPGPNVNVELVSSPGGLPGGFNGDIQYNNNGNLGGSAATITAAGAIGALSITATSATFVTATVTSTLELQTATIVDSLGSTGTVGQALESTGTGVKWAAVSSTETWAALTGAMTYTQVAPWYNATSTVDSGISRLGAASLAIGNGTAGDFSGSLTAKTVNAISGLLDSFAVQPGTSPTRTDAGAFGFFFTVTLPITVSQFGRKYLSGNTLNHAVSLWISTNTVTPLVSATILAASSSDGNGFKWVSISPIVLTPGNTYAIEVAEGTDTWLGEALQTLQPQFLTYYSAFSSGVGVFPTATSDLGQMYSSPAMMYTAENTLTATGNLAAYFTSVTTGPLISTSLSTAAGAVGTPSLNFGQTNTGWYSRSSHVISLAINGVDTADIGASNFELGSGVPLTWSSSSNAGGANDTGISRLAAGSLAIGNGTAGNTSGQITATTHTVAASGAAPTSAGTAGTVGQIIANGGKLYFCSVTGAAGSATWNTITLVPIS
jgi:hypothetical protein